MKTAAPPIAACLYLGIESDIYRATSLSPNPVVEHAWRLEKLSGPVARRDTHDICIDRGKPECTCPSFLYRQNPHAGLCKHLTAAVITGLHPNLASEEPP